jgi:GTP-binding protein
MFVDEAVVVVLSGAGGRGCVSFRREAGVPKGGPDGGDGGRGGDVWLVADAQKNTLVDFRNIQRLKAPSGKPGAGANCTGRSGEDLLVHVPPGTLVYDDETDELLADLDSWGQKVQILVGGRGGRGTFRFLSSTRRAPRYAQPGDPAVEKRLRLELKLLADVGIVGLPSVGKSTLIAAISSCRPKIAAYHFTTLVPNLGVVERVRGFPFVVADVPGLVAGAHEGRGLGIQFLKHVQRTSLLLHVLDATHEDPMADYETIRQELTAFDPALADRPEIVAINKVDIRSEAERGEWLELVAEFKRRKIPCLLLSAATGEGTDRLVNGLTRRLQRLRKAAEDETQEKS